MEHPIIFFDGVCNLCTGSVQFIIKRDRKDLFRFAALQSEQAMPYLSSFDGPLKNLDTILLLENGKIYQRSTAVLRIVRQLGGAWPLLYGLIIIPVSIRDWLYGQVAKRRYQFWGKQESCMVPTAELKAKFL